MKDKRLTRIYRVYNQIDGQEKYYTDRPTITEIREDFEHYDFDYIERGWITVFAPKKKISKK